MAAEDMSDACARIAILANGVFPYRVGGMQKHTTCLVRQLPGAGVQVDLYYLTDESYPPAAVVHQQLFDGNDGIRIRAVGSPRLPYFPGHYYLTCFWQSYWLCRALRQSQVDYDFIYAQGYTGWYSMLARKWRSDVLPPIGVHGHGLEALQEPASIWWHIKNTFAPVWQKWNIRLADRNLSLGGQLDDLLVAAGASAESILPAYNGIDEAWLRPLNEIRETDGNTRFLFVGRDTSRKGIAELNEAIQCLREEPRFEIHLAGDISEHRRISGRNVIYHNELREEEELRDLYCSCDVLVCPSYSEGMPTVILEAMASGLAVIATDVGAVRLVVDAQSGWLIRARDSSSLIDAMRSAMTKPILAKKRAARQRVEEFTWPKVTASFFDALCEYRASRP